MHYSTGQAGDGSPIRTALQERDTQALLRAFRESRDLGARDRFICEHLHLVYSVARRFSGLGESLDDLIQEGAVGLLNAVDLYDPDRGVKFSTYACHLIGGQIQHYLRDRGRLIRQPAWVQELSTKVTRMTEQLVQELGREPLPAEVAERLNVTEESLHNVLAARELNRVISLSGHTEGGEDGELPLIEKEKAQADYLASLQLPVEDRLAIDEAIEELKPLEQQVVRQFFFEDHSQTEIARGLGISINYTSYLLRRSIAKIRAAIETQREAETVIAEPAAPTEITYVVDPYTGMHGQAYLRARVAEEMERCKRYPTNFALMIGTVHGLPTGNDEQCQAVKGISQLLRSSTRAVDLITYHGDGRFGLLLPHTGREARILGERLCGRVARRADGGASPYGLSMGYGVYPIDAVDLNLLFHRVERALTTARKAGPGTVCYVGSPAR